MAHCHSLIVFYLALLVALCWPASATHGHRHRHLHEQHHGRHAHLLHPRNESGHGNSSLGADDLVAQALKLLATRNKARIENPKFNEPIIVHPTKDPELAPPLLVSGQNSTLVRRQGQNLTSSDNSTTTASAYSIPRELAEAAKRLAEASPQSPAGDHADVASMTRNKYRHSTNDTNAPDRLKTPEGKLSAWGPEFVGNVSEAVKHESSMSRRQSPGYWMVDTPQLGKSPFSGDPNYQVWRNVKDFGAFGDGVHDDTAAINAAIASGGRCGPNCGSSTRFPAVVYFPPGTYLVSSPIIQYYNTQFLGDPHSVPTILAAQSFVGLGVISSDVYVSDTEQWYLNTANFLRSIRNFKIDIRLTDPYAYVCAIHWQVAQASSLENIEFYMLYNSEVPYNTQQGIYMENGSGGFLADLIFVGGNFGAYFGNQQFTTSHLIFVNCHTALQVHWDWAWTMQDFIIEGCNSGLVVVGGAGGPGSTGQGVGSLVLVDSIIANTPNGIVTSLAAENSTSFLLQNVGFFNVQTAVRDAFAQTTLLAGGNQVLVGSWGFGRINDATTPSGLSTFVNGANIPAMTRKPELLGEAYDNMAPNLFTRRRPTYYNEPVSRIMNVKALGALGDGSTDDTAVLNSILEGAANTSSIVYFPFGIYIIRDTLRIPVGSRIIGQVWSQIMATGPKFAYERQPTATVQVGRPGDRGIVEIQDMMFTAKGATAGAVIIEWNVHESTKGSAGMWDSHIRIGGATGNDLQLENCPKVGAAVNSNCKAASMLMHMTPGSSGYLENVWLWTADHDMDKRNLDQIDIYVGRGLLVQSDLAWLWGTAVEHCVLYQYQLSGAKNILMGMIQTESPYFQPIPGAPLPFTPGLFPDDPTFNTTPSSPSSWAVRIVDSSSVYMLGAGLYSWFSGYSQTCLATENCQQRGFEVVQSSDLWVYNLCTKAIVEMVSPLGKAATLASQNVNGFLSSVLGWLHGTQNITGAREFEGFQIYTPESLEEVELNLEAPFPPICRTALTQLVVCHPLVASLSRVAWHGSPGNQTVTDEVCQQSCLSSVQTWIENVASACEGYKIEKGAPPELVGGRIRQGLLETCQKEVATGRYCNDIIAGFTTVASYQDMPQAEMCHTCFKDRHRMMQESRYSVYNQYYKDRFEAIKSSCGSTGSTEILPPIIPAPEVETACPSGLKHTVVAGDTCDSLALAGSFASAALFIGNPGKMTNCSSLTVGAELCLPIGCNVTYTVKENDTCWDIDSAHLGVLPTGVGMGAVRLYNPWVDFGCNNLLTASDDAYGYVICMSPQGGVHDLAAPPAPQPTRVHGNGASWHMVPLPAGADLAPGTTILCGKYLVAQEGDTCTILAMQGPTVMDLLLRANPSLGTSTADCEGRVVPGLTYCLLPLVGFDSEYPPEQEPSTTITIGGPYTESSTSSSSTSSTVSSSSETTTSTTSSTSTTTSSSSTSTSTSSTTSEPTSQPTTAHYYGCYTEATGQRALSGPSTTDFVAMTPTLCRAFCQSQSPTPYPVWGVEYGGECYCGTSLSLAAGSQPIFEAQCSVPCPGDPSLKCGGGNRLSLYGLSPSPPPTSPPPGLPPVTSFGYVGCRTEPATGGQRALGGASAADGQQMTPAACGSYCLGAGFLVFGVEYSAECWCGAALHPLSLVAPEEECGMPCSGDAAQMCGGPNRLSVWEWS